MDIFMAYYIVAGGALRLFEFGHNIINNRVPNPRI